MAWSYPALSLLKQVMAYDDIPITTADVKAVAALIGADLSVFIATGKLIVDENLLDKGLSDARLKLIWTYLAAHFGFIKEGQTKSETTGPVSETYNMTTGLGLKTTTHGQQAITLDTSGTLFLLDNRKSDENTPAKVASFTLLT